MFNGVVLLQLLVVPGNDTLLYPFMCSQHKPTKQRVRKQMAAEKRIWCATKSLLKWLKLPVCGNHSIVEWFGLEGTLKSSSSNSPATGRDTFH